MGYSFTPEKFDSFTEEWHALQQQSPGSVIFSSPQWTAVWWRHFGQGSGLYLHSIRDNKRLIGVAPLMLKDRSAFFAGAADVCDYMDFTVSPGQEKPFCTALLDGLATDGIKELDLAAIRPDSVVYTHLLPLVKQKGFTADCRQVDVNVSMELPSSWELYLQSLGSKQRHELRRKFRRLEEMGTVSQSTSTSFSTDIMDIFFRLFRQSRTDKADFLTAERKSFLQDLVQAMSAAGYLRLNLLELNGSSVAVTLCFKHKDELLLYNSGYDPGFRWLSAGLISKARVIEESIRYGIRCFNFLRGDEHYKYQLGGRSIPLYRCKILFG